MPYLIGTSAEEPLPTCASLKTSQDDSPGIFLVNQYNWGGEYRPQTAGRLLFLPDRGFLLQMYCAESDPVARYTQANEPVYQDSCMEAFIAFFPESDRPGYINFEINANGALLSQYGLERKDRRFLLDLGLTPPIPQVSRDQAGWGFDLLIDLAFIRSVYGQSSFRSGDVLKGNFFKVGQNVIQQHFVSYAPITTPAPDFHRPDFFTDLRIV